MVNFLKTSNTNIIFDLNSQMLLVLSISGSVFVFVNLILKIKKSALQYTRRPKI